jgi:hypothetical protein
MGVRHATAVDIEVKLIKPSWGQQQMVLLESLSEEDKEACLKAFTGETCYKCRPADDHVFYLEKTLFRNGNLTSALAAWWWRLWAGSGCGGSGRAPGWCGWAVASLLRRCCGGAVCWRPVISLLAQSVTALLVRWGDAWGCGCERAAAWASYGRGQLQQACGFTAV